MNLSMWLKYSENGKGFCVGFKNDMFFNYLGGGEHVFYVEKLPEIYHNDDRDTEFVKQVFFKEKKWEFEEEYRTHKFFENKATVKNRQIKLPQKCYKEIIFGWAMSNKSKNEIKEICFKNNFKISFIEMNFENGKLDLGNSYD